jgi:hypothetical protein
MSKEDAKASIRLAVKKKLREKSKYFRTQRYSQEIMDQAEGQYAGVEGVDRLTGC